MTIWEKIVCAIGLHGLFDHVGSGIGSVIVQGRRVNAVFRLWRCQMCGAEEGDAVCPQIPGFKASFSPDFVKQTSDFHLFDEDEKEKQ